MDRSIRILLLGLMALSLAACASSKTPKSAIPYSSQPAVGTTPTAATKPLNLSDSAAAQRNGTLVPATLGVPPTASAVSNYRIGPQDLLKVEVFQVGELTSRERVGDDGRIAMPLIGPIQVAGLTPREAEDKIAHLLSIDYLQNPQVSLFIEEYASQKVTVSGAVEKPGVFPLRGRTTLTQAIALAGGLGDIANTSEVILFRDQGTPAAQAYVVDIDKIDEGLQEDPVMAGDDRILVPKSGSAAFVKSITDTLRGFVRIY